MMVFVILRAVACNFPCIQRYLANANVIINTVFICRTVSPFVEKATRKEWTKLVQGKWNLYILRGCVHLTHTEKKITSSINMHYGYIENHMLINHQIIKNVVFVLFLLFGSHALTKHPETNYTV